MTDLDLDAIRGRHAKTDGPIRGLGAKVDLLKSLNDVPALIAEVQRLRSERHAAPIAALRKEAARRVDTNWFDVFDLAADYLESLDEEDETP